MSCGVTVMDIVWVFIILAALAGVSYGVVKFMHSRKA